MISNILIGLGISLFGYLMGCISGAVWVVNGIIKVDKMYEAKTGNSFVKWMFDENANLKKHRIEELYAAE